MIANVIQQIREGKEVMTRRKQPNARQQRIQDAITRLAGLFMFGELLAETDPAELLNKACDEIERLRVKGKSDG